MEPDRELQRSHLFTIRLWTEALGEGQVERRGRVQYVLSGERRYFHDWSTLVEYLDAQRAFNDTMESYNEARAGFARSLFLIDSVAAR